MRFQHSVISLALSTAGALALSTGTGTENEFLSKIFVPVNSQAAFKTLVQENSNLLASGNLTEPSGDEVTQTACAVLACSIGRLVFTTSIISSADTDYQEESEMNWSQTCWTAPQCIFRPSSANDVATSMAIIRATQSKFALRSGGHNPNPGFAGVNSTGVLIDLGDLTEMSLSDDKKTFKTGPGNTWDGLYHYLADKDVTVLGGRDPGVGVGGLLIGGGLSWFAGSYGMSCDNVESYEVVLSNASVVEASANCNPDLFWALKGGGPNYGIVTKFTLRTVPISKIWYQTLEFAANMTEDVIDAVYDFETASANDSKGAIVTTFTAQSAVVGLIYSEPVEKPAVFQSFFNIPSTTVVPSTIGSVYSAVMTYAMNATVARYDSQVMATKSDASVYKQAYAQWKTMTKSVATFAATTFSLQPIPQRAVLEGYQKGGNALGLSAVAQNWITGNIAWTDEAFDARAHAAISAYGDGMDQVATEGGTVLPFRYMNDASRDQNPLVHYGGTNVARLRDVSAKYDPAQVFQKLQNGGFLLSRS